ncbi:MAG TPA: phosphoribosylanthranilate isomerase [Geobacteraceae bacterium]
MIRAKICGITNGEDALQAVEAGADALGFVFHEKSPRRVSPEQAAAIVKALPPFVQAVGLFVNADLAFVNATLDRCRLDLAQLHGDEPPEYCDQVNRRVIKAFRIKGIESLDPIKNYRVAGYLLDAWSPAAYGGTGTSFNWEVAKMAEKYGPVILAGGLTPENVRQAVESVAPYAVDVSSGVESAPGRKDHVKVAEFIRRAKGW